MVGGKPMATITTRDDGITEITVEHQGEEVEV